jgi:dTMP kinase
MKKKGKIVVIDGIDGVGKKTQTGLLVQRFKKLKKKVVSIDFPQYEKNFFGRNLKKFLTQEEFNFLKTHPKIASLWFAADRWESKEKIEKFLKEGYIVVIDRYVTSNQIHQGSKFPDTEEGNFKRKEFIKWLDELEYKVFKLPKPDMILYLSLDPHTAHKLTESRTKDVAEKDLEHQVQASRSALKLSKEIKNVKVIDCNLSNGGIKSREEISDFIFDKVKKYL